MQPAQRDGRGQSWEIWLMRSQEKNLSQEIWSLQFDCPPSSCLDKVWIGQKERSSSFPVFGELCVERFITWVLILFTFFWVFLSGRLLLWLPLCNGLTGRGVGDWWLGRWSIRRQRGARTVPHTYVYIQCIEIWRRRMTVKHTLYTLPVFTTDTVCQCTLCSSAPHHILTTNLPILLPTINHSWRPPPTMPKLSSRTVETQFWSILGQLKSPQETQGLVGE